MPTLYLTHPGGILRYENHRFVVEVKDKLVLAVQEFKVENVVAFGPVHLTQPAVSRLLAKRAVVHFLTRFGVPKGRLCPADDTRSDVRLAQYRAFCDDDFKFNVARAIVAAKVANCRKLVMRCAQNHPDLELSEDIQKLEDQSRDAASSDDIESLHGIEGSAARRYFSSITRIIDSKELFDGRSRRPPVDPANALMSLGYTLLGGEIIGMLTSVGLDPYLGFYHQSRRGLPALTQDILEGSERP